MCHSIISLPDHRFYTYFPGLSDYHVYSVGIKRFRVSKNIIRGNFNWNVKSCKKIDVGLEIVSVLQKQDIRFPAFPGREYAFFKIQMNLGAHIHSFSKKNGLHPSALITRESYPASFGEDGLYYFLDIPVLFEAEDITFFDGEDVSVSRFVIPSLETMAEILGEKDLRPNGYKNTPFRGIWQPKHEKLYTEAYATIPEAIRAMKRDGRLGQAAIKRQHGTR